MRTGSTLKKHIVRIINRLGIDVIPYRPTHLETLPLEQAVIGFVTPPRHSLVVNAPIPDMTWESGFSMHPDGWNPYVATVAGYLDGRFTEYAGSPLEQYYTRFLPETAAEYLCPHLVRVGPLSDIPARAFLPPWSLRSPEQAQEKRLNQNQGENRAHLRRTRTPVAVNTRDTSWGINKMGPVSEMKGRVEFGRLAYLADSIKRNGYRRDMAGDIKAVVLRHNGLLLYVVRAGYHRLAVLAALGVERVAVRLLPPAILDRAILMESPAVRDGYWSKQELEIYMDFLFNERGDSRARAVGLIP